MICIDDGNRRHGAHQLAFGLVFGKAFSCKWRWWSNFFTASGTECKGCLATISVFSAKEWTRTEQIKGEKNTKAKGRRTKHWSKWKEDKRAILMSIHPISLISVHRSLRTCSVACMELPCMDKKQQANFIEFLFSMLHVSSPDTSLAQEFLFFGGAAIFSMCGPWALPWRKAASSVKPRSRPLWKPAQLKNINLDFPQKGVIKHTFSSCFQGWQKRGKPRQHQETHSLLHRNLRSSALSRGKVPSMKQSNRGKWLKNTTNRSGTYPCAYTGTCSDLLYLYVYILIIFSQRPQIHACLSWECCFAYTENFHVELPVHRPKMGISLSLQAWFF